MSLAERLQRDWWRPGLTPLTALLTPLSGLYRLLAALDRRRSLARTTDTPPLPVPVVVVGNLIVGGAGKTPTVIALVHALRARGFSPGIISRGYGRPHDDVREVAPGDAASDVGDEPLLMQARTRAPLVVGRDRRQAALSLCAAHPEVDVVVSDDGLQHHRLPRTVELVVFDERGVGNGRLLPAGPLREALPASLPPRRLVAYNAPSPSTPLPGFLLRRRLAGVVPLSDWWRGRPAELPALHALRGRPLVAAAGMAHPGRFFRMLEDEGLAVRAIPLPDHHAFQTLPWPADTPDVVVTEKDAVKLLPERAGSTRVWVAALDLSLPPELVDRCVALLRDSGRLMSSRP